MFVIVYTVTKIFVLGDCQLQEGSKFFHESLASCSLADKIDRKMYLTMNITFLLASKIS